MNQTNKMTENEAIGIVKKAFAIIEDCPEDAEWKKADQLISQLYDDFADEDFFWKVFDENDPRNYLLELWLIRYQILYYSDLGSTFYLFEKVQEYYPNIPSWIGNIADSVANLRIDSVEDFICVRMDDIDFYEELTVYLDKLPLNKDSAYELIDAINSYDFDELYDTLFSRFKDFLSEEEKEKLIKKHENTFSLPFDYFETDE